MADNNFTFDVIDAIVSDNLIEEGFWLHLDHPLRPDEKLFLNGDPQYPVRVKTRSARSKIFREHELRAQSKGIARARQTKSPKGDQAAVFAATVEEGKAANFAVLAAAFENFDSSKPGQQVVPDPAFVKELAARSNYQWVVDQVWAAASDQSNYGVEETSGGNADAGAAVSTTPAPKGRAAETPQS